MVVESAERAVGEVSAAQVRALDLIVCLAFNCLFLFFALFVIAIHSVCPASDC
jgi:hypothetical protein